MSRVHVRPTARTRKRRMRRRFITLLTYAVVVFALSWFFESQGTTTVIFVRHADIDQPESATPDAPLNAAGRARAQLFADTLQLADVVAGPDAIYVDETLRTQETAAPLAARIGIEASIADHEDVQGFMNFVLRKDKRKIVLVVTQRDDISPLIEELHGSKNIAPIGADDYDDYFIVSIPWFGKVKTLQLRYGVGWNPGAL